MSARVDINRILRDSPRYTHYRAVGETWDGKPFDELRPFTQSQAAGLGKGLEVTPEGIPLADAAQLVRQWNSFGYGPAYSLPTP